jgi:hypothetical protein
VVMLSGESESCASSFPLCSCLVCVFLLVWLKVVFDRGLEVVGDERASWLAKAPHGPHGIGINIWESQRKRKRKRRARDESET